ncbi:MAG TPA: PAS domain S-box protein, partial [Verrucomicrobiae bacterium]|nr:PAS domain S-box protein [Verrucomicrobiae bacterium]
MNVSSIDEITLVGIERRDDLAARKKLEEKIAVLEEFNRLLVESTGDCILVVDAAGQVLSINKTGRELLQIPVDQEILVRHWTTLFPDFEARSALGREVIPKARSTFQASSRTGQGEIRYWNIIFTSFGPDPDSERFVLIARDTTEHMTAERALRQSEAAFRKIFEENPIGMVIADLEYRITKLNSALSGMLGFSEGELIGKDIRDLPVNREKFDREKMQRLLKGEIRSFQCELNFQTKRKHPFWTHLTTSLLRDAENLPAALLQMAENIQDRKTSEEQLLAYQAQLQSLASEVALSEERERRKIATNLHDRIGQSLAFARLKLTAPFEKQQDKVVAEIRELLDQAIADTRSLTFELSPPVLYELGLVAAIEWLTRKTHEDHRIQTRFHDDGQPKPLDDNLRIVLFQGVREILVNVVKHARASHTHVILRRDADALRIIVEDDGIGFDLNHVSAKRETARSFGLFNIRER